MQLFYLMGPTASGKTDLALALIRDFPFEIISVDSAMVYRGMDIGTAKPSSVILKNIPHHLINIRDPGDPYSVADFCVDVRKLIPVISSRKKIPLLVGGTMMYFHALHQGLAPMPSADAEVRLKLLTEGTTLGWDVLHQRLQKIDPKVSSRIHPHDSQRIQRALEVYQLTGKPLSLWQQETQFNFPKDQIHRLIIAPIERSILHHRIAKRFGAMLQSGFIDEVEALHQRPDLNLEMPSMRSVGYRQAWEYLSGRVSIETFTEKAIIATRQLAKRQLTWLRRLTDDAKWFNSESKNLKFEVIQHIAKLLHP